MAFMDLPVANLLIDAGALIVLGVVILGLAYRVKGGVLHRFDRWGAPAPGGAGRPRVDPGGALKDAMGVLFVDVFATRPLRTCGRAKWVSHLAIFWGFAFLGVSTTLAFLTNPDNRVLPLADPVKLFGNTGGLLVVAGFAVMFAVRYQEGGSPWKLTTGDYFLVTLFLAVLTGFVTQQAVYSFAGPEAVAWTFWIHMTFVVLLLATAPFTKFGHAVFKPVWLLYERLDERAGREPLLPVPGEGAAEV